MNGRKTLGIARSSRRPRWITLGLLLATFLLCSAFDECLTPGPEEVATEIGEEIADELAGEPSGEPVDELVVEDPITPITGDPTLDADDDLVVPEDDLAAVLPARGDVLCVHPDHVGVALERLRAEPLGDGTYLSFLEGPDGRVEEAHFELIALESPYLCSDLHRAEQDSASELVDLVALLPEDSDTLCVHPRYVEQVLQDLHAEPLGEGFYLAYLELPELDRYDEIVFDIELRLAPVACGGEPLRADDCRDCGTLLRGPAEGGASTPRGAGEPVWTKGRFRVFRGECNIDVAPTTGGCVARTTPDDERGAAWRTSFFARKRCGRGDGLCVEVESLVGRTEYYRGADCTGGVVHSVGETGHQCFVSEASDEPGGFHGDPAEEDDRFRVYKDAACVLYEAAFDSRCSETGSPHGSFVQRHWQDWHRCKKGTGYCAEGKQVVAFERWYDSRQNGQCLHPLHEQPLTGFACQP